MKTQVNFTDFVTAFQDMGRFDQFGYAALKALFEYLEEFEEGTGEELELDVIALCCEFSVMDLDDINQQYSKDEPFEDMEDAVEYLRNETTVIEVDDGHIIVQGF